MPLTRPTPVPAASKAPDATASIAAKPAWRPLRQSSLTELLHFLGLGLLGHLFTFAALPLVFHILDARRVGVWYGHHVGGLFVGSMVFVLAVIALVYYIRHPGLRAPRIPKASREAWLVAASLLLLVVAAGYFRFAALDERSFWNDESSTSLQVHELLETGIPRMDSGQIHDRGIANFVLMGVNWQLFGQTDSGARLPAALFGVLLVPLVYELGRRMDRRLTGLGAAAFVTFCWWLVAWSRQARFYEAFVFFYALAVLLYYSLERGGFRSGRTWTALLLSLGLTALCNKDLAPLIVFPIGASAFWAALRWSLAKGATAREQTLRRATTYGLSIAGIAGLVLLVVDVFLLDAIMMRSVVRASGQGVSADPIRYSTFYQDFLVEELPLATFLGTFGSIVLLVRRPREGSYILLNLVLPYLVLSTILVSLYLIHPFERYILVLLPFLAVTSASALASLFEALAPVASLSSRPQAAAMAPKSLAILLVLAGGTFASAPIDVAYGDWGELRFEPQPDYRFVADYIRENGKPTDTVCTPWPENFRHYLPNPGCWLTSSPLAISIYGRPVQDQTMYYLFDVALVSTTAQLDAARLANRGGWIVIDKPSVGSIESSLMKTITSFPQAPSPPDGTLLVYRWDSSKWDLVGDLSKDRVYFTDGFQPRWQSGGWQRNNISYAWEIRDQKYVGLHPYSASVGIVYESRIPAKGFFSILLNYSLPTPVDQRSNGVNLTMDLVNATGVYRLHPEIIVDARGKGEVTARLPGPVEPGDRIRLQVGSRADPANDGLRVRLTLLR